ncbi:uncharacterized protein UTRI_10669 [Ustilago trichophora]|uniref:Uncharacterized protein n=1 Tax=Ustilago trichophora TaxID=86804 RepID=A0A5C3EA64_9BASI|nr:uncharacterized protein UTRI_10669 [Ustilago trichophora]
MLAVAKNRIVYVFLIAVLAVTVSAWRPHFNAVDAEMIEQARTAELDLRREQMHAGTGDWGKLAPKTGLFAYWKTPFLRQRAWKLAQANGVMYLGSSEPTEASEASAREGQRNLQAYHYFASVLEMAARTGSVLQTVWVSQKTG